MSTTKETIVAKVTRVSVFNNEGKTSVTLKLNKEFKGFKFQKTSDSWEESMVDEISMSAGQMLELCETNEIAAFYMSVIEDRYSQRAIGTMMFGAEIVISRELHVKGEVIEGTDKALDRDKWFTTISRYTPGQASINLMNKTIGC